MENNAILSFLGKYFQEFVSVIGAVGMFFLGRKARLLSLKQQSSTIKSTELESVESALKIYRTMLEDLQERLTVAEKAYSSLEDRLHVAIEHNKTYELELSKLKKNLIECLDK